MESRNETKRPVGIEIFKSVAEAFLLSIFFVRRASWKGWIYHASRPSRRALNQAHNLAVVRLSRLSVSPGQPPFPNPLGHAVAAGHVPRNVSLTPKSDEDALNKRGARISVFINMAARFMPRVGPSRETSEEGEREKGAATRWSATMLFGQRLLPLYSIVASKGPKRRMKRRRESASVQTYSSPREYKVNRPPLQCSGTNLAFLSLSPSSSSTETAFCALLSSALALFLPLPLSSPERSHQPFFFSFLSSFFLSHPLLSLSLSFSLPFLSFLFLRRAPIFFIGLPV